VTKWKRRASWLLPPIEESAFTSLPLQIGTYSEPFLAFFWDEFKIVIKMDADLVDSSF
jgi:hypothetical protein